MKVRRMLGIAAVLIAVGVLGFLLVPFHASATGAPLPKHEGLFGVSAVSADRNASVSCGPAVVDAWHSEGSSMQFDGEQGVVLGSCRSAAQHRLRVGLVGLVVAGALGAAAMFGFARRRPAPAM